LDYLNKIGLNYPLWNGQLDCRSLLVVGEQGIGDHIFYSSMLSELTYKVKKITVLIDTRLIRLLARSFKNINFISLDSNYINKEELDIYINSIKELIKSFLVSNTNHSLYSLWNNYYNQILSLNTSDITYPLNTSLEEYFNNLNKISLNPLQLP